MLSGALNAGNAKKPNHNRSLDREKLIEVREF